MSSEDAKKYCYTSDCDIVMTGFQWDSWQVCRSCKCEVTESLAKSIAARELDKKDKEVKKDEDDDIYGFNPWFI